MRGAGEHFLPLPNARLVDPHNGGGPGDVVVIAPAGTPVHAVCAGTVRGVDGAMLEIDGDDGHTCTYAAVRDPRVTPGARIDAGAIVGVLGAISDDTPALRLSIADAHDAPVRPHDLLLGAADPNELGYGPGGTGMDVDPDAPPGTRARTAAPTAGRPPASPKRQAPPAPSRQGQRPARQAPPTREGPAAAPAAVPDDRRAPSSRERDGQRDRAAAEQAVDNATAASGTEHDSTADEPGVAEVPPAPPRPPTLEPRDPVAVPPPPPPRMSSVKEEQDDAAPPPQPSPPAVEEQSDDVESGPPARSEEQRKRAAAALIAGRRRRPDGTGPAR